MRFFPLLIFLWCLSSQVVAQLQLDRFYPCVVSTGTTTTIKAEGKFPSWPIELRSDREDISWDLNEESGTIQLTVDPNAHPGVIWFRALDSNSASDLVPLLITNTSVVTETEPNQKRGEANQIDLPISICGRLEKSGDLDGYLFSATAGEQIIATLRGHQILGSPMDAVLQIADADGNILFQEDDTHGLDPSIRFVSPSDGNYLLRVFAFPETPNSTIGYAGSASYLYTLSVCNSDAWIEHFLPLYRPVGNIGSESTNPGETVPVVPVGWSLASNESVQLAPATDISPMTAFVPGKHGWQWIPSTKIQRDDPMVEYLFEASEKAEKTPTATIPFSFSGHIEAQGETDTIEFKVKAGKRYRASIDAKRFGYPIDTTISIVASDSGEVLAKNDDQIRNIYDSAVTFQSKEDATLKALISDTVDSFGPHHAYSLTIQEVTPSFTLTVPSGRFSVKPGEELEVIVAINRLDGFDKEIEILLEPFLEAGINEQITAEPVTSEPKGDSAKTVKLIIKTSQEADYQGYLQITGLPKVDESMEPSKISATHELRPEILVDRQFLNVRKTE